MKFSTIALLVSAASATKMRADPECKCLWSVIEDEEPRCIRDMGDDAPCTDKCSEKTNSEECSGLAGIVDGAETPEVKK